MSKTILLLIGVIVLNACSPDSSQKTTGPEYSLASTSSIVEFGILKSTDSQKLMSATIYNNTGLALPGPATISSPEFSFISGFNCPLGAKKNVSCPAIKLTFNPSGKPPGEYNATLNLGTISVPLHATVESPVDLSPEEIAGGIVSSLGDSINYGSMISSNNSITKTITFTNNNNQSITGSINYSSLTPFILSYDTCSNKTIAKGKNCQIKITLSPSSLSGTISGSLNYLDHIVNFSATIITPQSVAQSGEPAVIEGISYSSNLQFLVNNSIVTEYQFSSGSTPISVVLKNTGNLATTVDTPVLLTESGSGSLNFVSNSCINKSLGPNISCTIKLIASGNISSKLTFAGKELLLSAQSSAPVVPISITLDDNVPVYVGVAKEFSISSNETIVLPLTIKVNNQSPVSIQNKGAFQNHLFADSSRVTIQNSHPFSGLRFSANGTAGNYQVKITDAQGKEGTYQFQVLAAPILTVTQTLLTVDPMSYGVDIGTLAGISDINAHLVRLNTSGQSSLVTAYLEKKPDGLFHIMLNLGANFSYYRGIFGLTQFQPSQLNLGYSFSGGPEEYVYLNFNQSSPLEYGQNYVVAQDSNHCIFSIPEGQPSSDGYGNLITKQNNQLLFTPGQDTGTNIFSSNFSVYKECTYPESVGGSDNLEAFAFTGIPIQEIVIQSLGAGTTQSLTSSTKIGQSFIVPSSMQLQSVTIKAKKQEFFPGQNSFSGQLTIEVGELASTLTGQPPYSGVYPGTLIVQSIPVSAVTLSANMEEVNFTFSSAIILTPGKTYFFTLSTPGITNGSVMFEMGSSTSLNTYPNGSKLGGSGTTWYLLNSYPGDSNNVDLYFKIKGPASN